VVAGGGAVDTGRFADRAMSDSVWTLPVEKV
jgi:hypothetical protein